MTPSDIIGGAIRSRIHINEHLSPLCLKLNSLRTKIKNDDKITKFMIFHNDLPKISLTTNDSAETSYDLYMLLNGQYYTICRAITRVCYPFTGVCQTMTSTRIKECHK
uniref:Uncharacterized protein n=1 Tax=Glossina pallidipes TaxID=7398 RepID=A0A1A9ZKJ0_GLOPL